MRALCLFLLLAFSAYAQPVFVSVGPGSWVRVEAEADTVVGRLVTPDSLGFLVVRTPEASWAIDRGAVTGIWERVPATGRGTLRGAIVGGVIFGGIALGWATACKSDCGDMSQMSLGVSLFTASGAGLGGLVGMGVGALSSQWDRRYP